MFLDKKHSTKRVLLQLCCTMNIINLAEWNKTFAQNAEYAVSRILNLKIVLRYRRN